MTSPVRYLDHAATSAHRPAAVGRAIVRYLDEVGATPGRGGHRLAVEAGRIVLRARTRIRDLLGREGDPGRVVFGPNATWGLNTALQGVLAQGDPVVTTAFDHNAVLRPVDHLVRTRGVRARLVPGRPDGTLDESGLEEALDGASLLVINAASNVLGTLLPVAELVELAHAAGALALVDVCQTLGSVPVDLGAPDLIAFTGHKGLLGPQGTGGLWVRPGLDLAGTHQGGTGGNSHERTMPAALPDALEPGTLNGPGLAGLVAGCDTVLESGVEALHDATTRLKAHLCAGIDAIPGVARLSPLAPEGAGIVLVDSAAVAPAELARRMDTRFGVLTRPGLHCAPEVHRLLGTLGRGGLRLSLGWGSSVGDVEAALEALEECSRPSPRSVA